jgi:hypothetical protein
MHPKRTFDHGEADVYRKTALQNFIISSEQ